MSTITEETVNRKSDAYTQPGIGHNRQSLSAAAQANLETGVLLLCKEALITAIQDRRLQRSHLRVLAAIAMCINARTAKAWPDRAFISEKAGLSPKTVSNTILELRNWGYLIADRETVEEANGKRLTVYTFGNIDHDTIRKEITDWVNKLRTQRDAEEEKSSPPRGNSEVPAQGEVPRPGGTLKSPPRGKFPSGGEKSSPPAGDSNNKKEQFREREFIPAPVALAKNNPHMTESGFVISEPHGLVISVEKILQWRARFTAIADLESQLEKIASYILRGGIMHPGWTCPEGWVAGVLSDMNQEAANKNRVADARVAASKPKPFKPSRW